MSGGDDCGWVLEEAPEMEDLAVPTGNGGDKKDVNHCGTSGMSLVLCRRD